MSSAAAEQIELYAGVDVGGTFTDLVAFDGVALRVVKVASTPPEFEKGVIEAVGKCVGANEIMRMVHGSTVATNALLQRAGEQVAFITTEGFRDMLLIGRQNRPKLYALEVRRPAPITSEQNFFTVRERVDARGGVVEPLENDEIDRVVEELRARGISYAAVCLLFSFVNPIHEKRLAARLQGAGITVSLSSDVLPEFREYERASTTAINASLRPVVEQYMARLKQGLAENVSDVRVMQSGGGTVAIDEASASAARLVLSGPAGGVMGAAFVARQANFRDVISYDMGGTSTDVATVIDAEPQWTTSSTVDGLPLGLPMYDIHTVGAGGGSIAYLDAGGALRVGPRSAGAMPGPACYGRGGTEPTVTDANVVLGRIVPEEFLGGAMKIDPELARAALEPLARTMGKSLVETALGICRVCEANMIHAIRAVTAQRGHDPRAFALVSFGGAGGLHACALAEGLEISRVLSPPYAGVLSALGMVVSPPIVDVSRTIVQRSATDPDVEEEFARLASEAARALPEPRTRMVEYFADVRFRGQSHELKIALEGLTVAAISRQFYRRYREVYGRPPTTRAIEIVTLRVRRVGFETQIELPRLQPVSRDHRETELIDAQGKRCRARVVTRGELVGAGPLDGPALLIDPEATAFIPAGWGATSDDRGLVMITRGKL